VTSKRNHAKIEKRGSLQMSYAVLEQQIKALPEEYLEDIAQYVQLLQYKVAILNQQSKESKTNGIKLGLGEGMFSYPDDIHAGDEIIADAFKDYL
jgi:hypothetical protein